MTGNFGNIANIRSWKFWKFQKYPDIFNMLAAETAEIDDCRN